MRERERGRTIKRNEPCKDQPKKKKKQKQKKRRKKHSLALVYIYTIY